jgi:hypothetical protein
VQLTSDTIEEARRDLHCTGCGDLLGLADPSAGGWRLHKSSVALKSDNTASWESFSATSFVGAQLLALIESQAIRRFVLHSGPRGTAGGFLVSFGLFKMWQTHVDIGIALGVQSGSAVYQF